MNRPKVFLTAGFNFCEKQGKGSDEAGVAVGIRLHQARGERWDSTGRPSAVRERRQGQLRPRAGAWPAVGVGVEEGL